MPLPQVADVTASNVPRRSGPILLRSDLSIKVKLQILVVTIAGGAVLLACVTFLIHDLLTTRGRLAERLRNEVSIVASNCKAAVLFDDARAAREILEALGAEPSVLAAGILLPDSRVFARFDRRNLEPPVRWPTVLPLEGHVFEGGGIVVVHGIVADDLKLGSVVVVSSLDELWQRQWRFASIVLMTLVASLAVAFLLSTRFQRAISGPILELAEAAQNVSTHRDYSLRVRRRSRDEVGTLYDNFNEMMAQIQATDAELERHQTQLQEQVVERTAELEKTLLRLEIEVAERRQAQEEVTARNRDLETLLHVTSHDLREPLRGIANFSHLVHARYADRLDEKGRDFLTRVERGAERLTGLLEDILVLSRAQRMEPPDTEEESESIAREAVTRLEGKIRETGARVIVAAGLPRLKVNRTWATQAIYNLLVNALKFTRPGQAPDVEIAAYAEGGETGLAVRDRGPGVPPEYSERIFELFQRAVGREIEGSGAGLAIVRQIAERHGGRTFVRQRPGGGAEFVVTFANGTASRQSGNPGNR